MDFFNHFISGYVTLFRMMADEINANRGFYEQY